MTFIDCGLTTQNAGTWLCQNRTDYGTDDLGRAMALCQDHSIPSGYRYPEGGSPPPSYREGWEACVKVYQAWQESKRARQELEAIEKERTDRLWLDEFAKGLK